MYKRLIASVLLILVPFSINLHGGHYPYKDRPLWRLYEYKYTKLLQQEPLTWCPYKSYVLVDRYVTITDHDNYHWLNVNADLIELAKDDVLYNKAHAKRYKNIVNDKEYKVRRNGNGTDKIRCRTHKIR